MNGNMKKILFFMALMFVSAGCKGNSDKEQLKQEDGQEVRGTAEDKSSAEESTALEVEGLSNDDKDLVDISEIPKTANRVDSHFQIAVYVNEDKAPNEDDLCGVYTVWLADERAGTAKKLCQTNPNAQAQWEKMKKEDSDAVEVPIDQIAIASKAYVAPYGKVIVEGCPDARNVWTYIIDPDKGTAKQFPSTEGVMEIDWEKEEIILASYGYDIELGRYTYNRAYSVDGKFIRVASEKETE